MMKNMNRIGAFAAVAFAVATSASVSAETFNNWVEVGEDHDEVTDAANEFDTVVIQTNHTVTLTTDTAFGRGSTKLAWFLSGGVLQKLTRELYPSGVYTHFRQTGGLFDIQTYICRSPGYNNVDSLPAEYIYGETAVASNKFDEYCGPLTIAVMDNAQVYGGSLGRLYSLSDMIQYRRTVAMNGGQLIMNTWQGLCTNTFYSFNGGFLSSPTGGDKFFGSEASATTWIRVYEKGGELFLPGGGANTTVPEINAPVGNVVLSVELTPAAMSNIVDDVAQFWEFPPSVEILDSTPGGGSNAVAIVDYDFRTKTVTNITVICRGENYSGTKGDVMANFRYSATGGYLLSTPLECTTGPCDCGVFTFAHDAGKTFKTMTTNTIRGAIMIDMDRSGEYDGKAGGELSAGFLAYWSADNGYSAFPNVTNIIMKSGLLDTVNGRIYFANVFPSCRRMELYGGHLGYATASSIEDAVIGGRFYLCAHNMSVPSYLTVANTITVDYGAVKTNGVPVVPAISKGGFTFGTESKIALKDWNSLPRGKRIPILDLSDTDVTGVSRPTVIQSPEEGVLVWDTADKILYARRYSDGMFLIFR